MSHTEPKVDLGLHLCPQCNIVIQFSSQGGSCPKCSFQWSLKDLLKFPRTKRSLKFSRDLILFPEDSEKEITEDQSSAALINRECSNCGHSQMRFATMQLRSADEGQTVFYSCPKCEHREFVQS